MKRLRRWLFLALMMASLLAAVATVALWLRGTDWIRHAEAFTTTDRDAAGKTLTDWGIHSIGIYSHGGRMGIVSLRSGTPSLAAEELPLMEPRNAKEIGWLWTRTGHMDDYMGGIPDDLVPTYVTWSAPHCLYLFAAEEDGMRHFLRINAVLVSAPVLLVLVLLPWEFYLLAAFRRYRRKPDGRCIQCSYDLRASPHRCPECGMLPHGRSDHAKSA